MDAGERLDHHGGGRLRGLAAVPRSSTDRGRFGRLFRTLPALAATDGRLEALAREMVEAADRDGAPGDNPDIPAAYTYLGQFLDHDLTFDPVSNLERLNDPDALESFRTPRYDLDCLYGGGRSQSPYLYDEDDPVKLLVGHNTGAEQEPVDLPRNRQGRALVGDPRNDVHVIVSQLHLAFIHFHNAVVDHLRGRFFPDHELEGEARRLVCWHYQWIVVHDFLARVAGRELVDEILGGPDGGRAGVRTPLYSWRRRPWIPVEFSAAAYRFGHSMVRRDYRLNGTLDPLPVFSPAPTPHPLQHLGGFRPLPARWAVEWGLFVSIDGSEPQASRLIDTHLAAPLHRLPESIDRSRRSLALLNLLRGRALQLPSGQAVARAVGTALPDDDLGLDGDTPLWFYLLREAEVATGGRRLGPTGGRIVAEVLVGLLAGDPSSFLRQAPGWAPELPAATPGTFTLADLLVLAGAT